MIRTCVAAGLLIAAAALFDPQVDACGDKSLSAGGIRWQRALAARYPASVLAYAPANSRFTEAKRELKLEETLQGFGHTYREVADLAALQASLATGHYNIVLADFSDAPTLQRDIQASGSRAVLVPVAYKLTRVEGREAAKQCRFLINAPTRSAQYLQTIAQAVASRSVNARKG